MTAESVITDRVAEMHAAMAKEPPNEVVGAFGREQTALAAAGAPTTAPAPSRPRSSAHSTSLTSDQSDISTPGKGQQAMTVRLGILAQLDAAPGKGAELAAFLQAGRELAVAEQGTVTWYAFQISDTRYGIFDTFETDDARQAHLNGEIPAALGQVAPDLLASAPDIRTVDVIAVK